MGRKQQDKKQNISKVLRNFNQMHFLLRNPEHSNSSDCLEQSRSEHECHAGYEPVSGRKTGLFDKLIRELNTEVKRLELGKRIRDILRIKRVDF